jgi:hypothetical protein
MSRQRDGGPLLDAEGRAFLARTGLVVLAVEAVVLAAIWLVQQYFS